MENQNQQLTTATEQGIQTLNSSQQWLETLNSEKAVIAGKRTSAMNLERCLKESPQINTAKKDLGEHTVTAIITKAINETCVLTGSPLSADAIVLTAQLIANQYWHLRMDEILLVLRNGIANQYGISNKNLNTQIILQWLAKHEEDREEFFYNRHLEYKNSSGNPADRTSTAAVTKDDFEQAVDDKVEKRIAAFFKSQKEKGGPTDEG
jgi:hypothetical protein